MPNSHATETQLKTALRSAIFNSANFSSIATDARGVIQIFNVGAERTLGYTAAEVMNKVTPADISEPREVIARAKALSIELGTTIAPGFEALVFKASRGIEDIYELTYIRKDRSRLPAVVSVTALRDANDTIIGYLLIGTDNTARKQAEEASLKAGALQNAIFNSANFSSIAILMDIQLPGMDGLEAIAQLKRDETTRRIPVIALTALAMKGDEERIRAAGCDFYIAKPIRYREFLSTIAAQLARTCL